MDAWFAERLPDLWVVFILVGLGIIYVWAELLRRLRPAGGRAWRIWLGVSFFLLWTPLAYSALSRPAKDAFDSVMNVVFAIMTIPIVAGTLVFMAWTALNPSALRNILRYGTEVPPGEGGDVDDDAGRSASS